MKQSRVKQGQRTDAPSAPSLAAQGTSGLNQQWGFINDEPQLKLKGRRAMKEFREMHDNNAVVGGIVRLATDLIAQTEWSVEAAGSDPSTDLVAKHIAETSLRDMQSTWQECVDEIMTMAPFGHANMEMWFKKRLGDHELKEFNSKHADGYYGLANLALRAQESLDHWNIADDGDILGMWQRPAPSYNLRYIDAHRSVLFRTNAAKQNPEGRSWYRPGWRSWWICKRMEEIEGIGVERDVSGYPDFQVPLEYFLAGATAEQTAMLTAIKKMAERIRQDKYAGIVRPSKLDRENNPTGFDFSLISSGSRNATVFDLIIKRYESRIAISLLGEFVLLGQDKVGSFALASTKTNMFATALGAVLNRIADMFNRHVFPRLVRANGLPGACSPTLKFEDIESDDATAFASSVGQLVGAGVLTPDNAVERYVRDYLNLPPIGEVSPAQLEDANGVAQERVNGADDPGIVDAADVARGMAGAVPGDAKSSPAAASGHQLPLPLNVEQSADSPTMSPDECAAHAGVSRASIIAAIRRGQLPGTKIGASYRIPREDFMAFMSGGRRP